MGLLLADELLLLAYHPEGQVYGGAVPLDCAVAGSLLVELVLAGVVTCTDQRVDPVTRAPRPSDPELLAARDEIGRRPPRSPERWVLRLARGLRRRRLDELIAAGILAEETYGALGGLITRSRFPELDPAPRRDAGRRLRGLARGAGAGADERTRALAALVYAAGQGEHVFGAEYAEVEQRIARLAEAHWATPALRAAVRAVYAGMMSAAMGMPPG
jgi:hypothetical protein